MKRLVVVLGALLALGAGVARGGGRAARAAAVRAAADAAAVGRLRRRDGAVLVDDLRAAGHRRGGVAVHRAAAAAGQGRARPSIFDLYLNNRVGTPSKPADPGVIQARADKLFDTAVTSSGCDHPLIAENELFGAQLPTPWTATTAQYRANVLAYLQRLAERGARPFLLLSNRPYTHDPDADAWWQAASQVADIVPEVYFSGPQISKQGAVAGSRRLRETIRTRMEDLIQIGVPTNRLGMMLTFSSTPKAGGREGLQPLSKWLDVVKWEAIAARQVAGELQLASIWSWGWAAFNPAGNDPDKPKAACAWLWTRDHSLCDAPGARGEGLRPVARRRATLCRPGRSACSGRPGCSRSDVSALNRLTGNRDLAYSAELQHAVLAQAAAVGPGRGAGGGRHDPRPLRRQPFRLPGGARAGQGHAGARAPDPRPTSCAAARSSRSCACPAPSQAALREWFETYAAMPARPVRAAQAVPWLGNLRSGVAVSGVAPGRLLALSAGRDGDRSTA